MVSGTGPCCCTTPCDGDVPRDRCLVPGRRAQPGVVRLVHAPGGAGKTRLAQEIARALHCDGWVAGVHGNDRELRRAIVDGRAALNDGNRLFIAVDYAEALVERLVSLLDELGSSPARGLRILLLARSAGPWWTTFLQNPYTDLLVDRTPISLAVHPNDPVAEYHHARRAFTRAITGSEEATTETPPPIVDQELRSTLEIHAAALDAVIGQGSSAEANPLEGVLHHERRYWDRVSGAHAHHRFPAGDPLADRLLALPTLYPAPTLSDASSAVTQLTGTYGDVTRPDLMARALISVYPNDGGGWEPLRPDRLAETLVADVLLAYADRQEMMRDLMAIWRGLAEDQLEAGLTVIARLAENANPNLGRGPETVVNGVARTALDICLTELTETAPAALIGAAAGLAAPTRSLTS